MNFKTNIFRGGKEDSSLNKDIYSKPSNGTIFSPFNFRIDPMEHLILVNFEKDPDELYNIFELQQAVDINGEKGLLVIAYRVDGATDVYHQKQYPFGSQESVLNNASFFERPMGNGKFDVSTDQILVYFDFKDRKGREIKVSVKEINREEKKPFFLLAPIGSVSKRPTSLPVYSLYQMSFTRRKFTDIVIEIDAVKRTPDTFPIPIDCSKNYFTRYSVDTFNVDWNTNFKGSLSPITPVNNSRLEEKGITYEFIQSKGHYEIVRISTRNKKHEISIEFHPAIPDIVCLSPEIEIDGSFSITTDNSTGIIRGNYKIKRQDNEIDIEIIPNSGWKPHEDRWVLKILFRVVKVFREWPKSYAWNAKIKLNDTGLPSMHSAWRRI